MGIGEVCMKKIWSFILMGVLCLGLIACGSSDKRAEKPAETAAAGEITEDAAEVVTGTAVPVDAEQDAESGGFEYKKIYEYPEPTVLNSQAPVDNLNYVEGTVPKIAFMPAGLEYTYYQAVGVGVEAAAKELGAEVVTLAPMSGSDINTQVGMVQDAITMGVNVILLNPHDDAALAPVITEAINAGVAVFNLNSDSLDFEVPLSGVVGYDQYNGNLEQGKMIAEQFQGEELKIGIIEGLPGYHTVQRCGGFEEGIKDHQNYEIVSRVNGSWTVDGGNTACMDMVQANPEINMIYCANDQEAEGAYMALKMLNRTDIILIANDGDTEFLEMIYDGNGYSTLNTVPYEMGLYACQAAVDILYGKFEGGWVQTPGYVTTKDNVLDFLQQPERLSPQPSKEY